MATESTPDLETGWEPTTPADDTLLRHGGLAISWTWEATSTLGADRLHRDDQCSAVVLGRPTGLFNNATVLRPLRTDALSAAVDRFEEFYDAHGTGAALLWSRWPTPNQTGRGWPRGSRPRADVGPARWWRELRRRHRLHLPAPPGRPRGLRCHRDPAGEPRRGGPAHLPGLDRRSPPDDVSSIVECGSVPEGADVPDEQWGEPCLTLVARAATDLAHGEALVQPIRDLADPFEPLSTGREYLNFPGFLEDGQRTLRAAHGEANYVRLCELKLLLDPHNLFRLHQNMDPG